jgi:predicted metal-dependent RNase
LKSSEKDQVDISQHILENIPPQAEVTRIEYEGPALAVYTKKPEVLVEQSHIIADIVKLIRKRIVVRSDPSIRSKERETERVIKKIVSEEAEITNINFDPSLGEVIIEAKKTRSRYRKKRGSPARNHQTDPLATPNPKKPTHTIQNHSPHATLSLLRKQGTRTDTSFHWRTNF